MPVEKKERKEKKETHAKSLGSKHAKLQKLAEK